MMKWKQFLTPVKSIDTDELKKYLADNDADSYTLLDVRQPEEYESGHIPGAKLIPTPDLIERLVEINTNKPVLVY